MIRSLGRRFAFVVAIAMLVQIGVVLATGRLGVLSIDEVTYLAMARSFARSASFAIANGWDVRPSPELEWELVRAVDGRLVAQYPYGQTILTWPLYAALGSRGLVVANVIAFFGTVAITDALARRVLGKRSLALLAAGIFALATFGWTYSFAIWPHALTTFFVTASIHAAVLAMEGRRSALFVASGLLAGVAATMRLDGAFVVPALLLAPAVAPRSSGSARSLGAALLVAVGFLPACVLLGAVNHAKWGSWQPFSYGPWHGASSNTGTARYVPLAIAGVVVLVVAHVAVRHAARIRARHVAVASAVALVPFLLVPSLRELAIRFLRGAWLVLVDMRSFEGANESAMLRGPRGAVIYVGALKQALLQSAPWIPLAVVSPFARGPSRGARLVLAASALAYAGVFASSGWHGGLCLEQRYLLPALPALSVLAAHGAYVLLGRSRDAARVLRATDRLALVVLAIPIALVALVVQTRSTAAAQVVLLDAPIVVALALAIACGAATTSRLAARAGLGIAVVSWAWAAASAFGQSAPATLRARAWNARVAAEARPFVHAGDLVLAEWPDLAAGLLEDDVLVADGHRDRFEDAPRLAAAACGGARTCIAIVRPAAWKSLADADPPLETKVLAEPGGLVVGKLAPRALDSREEAK